ncbi:MAG: superoxide dismutase family protein [Acidobacteriota bacterium]
MSGRKASVLLLAGCLILVLNFACSREDIPEALDQEIAEVTAPDITEAITVLHPTAGNEVTGTIRFTQSEEGVRVVAEVNGLAPGKHGFHIHDLGNCSMADGTSAGGHYNPDLMPHGAPEDAERHLGDLGNLVADDTGVAQYERVDTMISLNDGHSIIGRAIIVHAGEDDLQTQPTGAAGARVACGVIGIAGVAE